ESELRYIEQKEKLTKVKWINSPSEGSCIIVECYLTPPVDVLDKSRFPFSELYSFKIPKGNWFVALHREESVLVNDSLQLSEVKKATVALAKNKGIELTPNFRGAAFLTHESGAKGFVEYVPMA